MKNNQEVEKVFGRICELFIETDELFARLINENIKNNYSSVDMLQSGSILKNINRQRNMLEDMISVFVLAGVVPISNDETIMSFTHRRLKKFSSLEENVKQTKRFLLFCEKIMKNSQNEMKVLQNRKLNNKEKK